MDLLTAVPLFPKIRDNATMDQRVELILDLTRRLELLDDLLRTARAKRCAREKEIIRTEICHAEIEAVARV